MPSAYIIWDRKEQRVICSSGVPLVFPTSADATSHATGSISGNLATRSGGGGPAKTYDVLTVQIA